MKKTLKVLNVAMTLLTAIVRAPLAIVLFGINIVVSLLDKTQCFFIKNAYGEGFALTSHNKARTAYLVRIIKLYNKFNG